MSVKNETPVCTLENGQVVWGYNAKRQPICNSRLRNKPGRRCQQFLGLFKNGRCEDHGGKSPSGISSPQFKTGVGSKYGAVLTPAMSKEFDRLLTDPTYVSLQEDIALARMRFMGLIEVYSKLDAKAVDKLKASAEYAEELLAGEFDENDLEGALRGLIEHAKTVGGMVAASKELDRAQEGIRRLAETENKRITQEAEQIPAHRAIGLFRALQQSVHTHVWILIKWLKREYPEVVSNRDFPNPLIVIANDIDRLLPRSERMSSTTIEEDETTTDLVRSD